MSCRLLSLLQVDDDDDDDDDERMYFNVASVQGLQGQASAACIRLSVILVVVVSRVLDDGGAAYHYVVTD